MTAPRALPLLAAIAFAGCVVTAPKTPDELVGRDSPKQETCVQEDRQVVHQRLQDFLAACFTPRAVTTTQWTPVGVMSQAGVLDWTVRADRTEARSRSTVWAGGAYFLVADVEAGGPSCQARVRMHAISAQWTAQFKSMADAAANRQPTCLLTGRPL